MSDVECFKVVSCYIQFFQHLFFHASWTSFHAPNPQIYLMVFRWLGPVNISGKTRGRGWIPMSGGAGSVSRPLIGRHRVSWPLIGWDTPTTLPSPGGRGTGTASDTVKYFIAWNCLNNEISIWHGKRKYRNFLSTFHFYLSSSSFFLSSSSF